MRSGRGALYLHTGTHRDVPERGHRAHYRRAQHDHFQHVGHGGAGVRLRLALVHPSIAHLGVCYFERLASRTTQLFTAFIPADSWRCVRSVGITGQREAAAWHQFANKGVGGYRRGGRAELADKD